MPRLPELTNVRFQEWTSPWWIQLKDPPKEIGDRILKAVPNTEALFWVDFSVLEVFPPDRS